MLALASAIFQVHVLKNEEDQSPERTLPRLAGCGFGVWDVEIRVGYLGLRVSGLRFGVHGIIKVGR